MAVTAHLQARLQQGMLTFVDSIKAGETALLGLRGFRRTWAQTSMGPVHLLVAQGKGRGPTWVFIHGFASQAVDWAPLLRRMRAHCGRIVVPDLPGHGRSPQPAAGLSAESITLAAEEAIGSQLQPGERCILVGNSMGGLGAVRYAQRHRDRVQALALISPAGAPMDAMQLETLMQTFRITSFAQALNFVDRLFGKSLRGRRVTALGAWAHLNRPHLQALLRAYRDYTFLAPDELQNMPPTLLIWGRNDDVLPTSNCEFYCSSMPADTTVVHRPERFGHSPFFDLAGEVADLLLGWARAQGSLLAG